MVSTIKGIRYLFSESILVPGNWPRVDLEWSLQSNTLKKKTNKHDI